MGVLGIQAGNLMSGDLGPDTPTDPGLTGEAGIGTHTPETVTDGQTRLLVPAGQPGVPAQAIGAPLRAPARRQALDQAGQRRVETGFSIECLTLRTPVRPGRFLGAS